MMSKISIKPLPRNRNCISFRQRYLPARKTCGPSYSTFLIMLFVFRATLRKVHVALRFLFGKGEIGACGFSANCSCGVGKGGVDDDDVAALFPDVGTNGKFSVQG